MHQCLNNLSNRDYIDFDERYIKHTYNIVLMTLKNYNVTSELEANRRYMDLLILPKNTTKDYYSILIEFKYLKKSDENLLEETKAKAREQILEYSNLEKIKTYKS